MDSKINQNKIGLSPTVNILIGGTGFIGSALARVLIGNNEKVISIARPGKGEVTGVEYVGIDLDSDKVSQSLLDGADCVFLLIGQTGPNFDPEKEKSLLQEVMKPLAKGKQKVFFFSSVLVYGDTPHPADEQTPCRPIGVYPKFKLASETIVRDCIPETRLVIVRLANVYGSPKNRGFIGFAMKKATNSSDDTPLLLNGRGQMRRDYIFLDDVTEAVLAVKAKSGGSGTVNVATGQSVSLLDVVGTLSKVAGRQIPYEIVDNKPDEADVIQVSNQHLAKEYGFRHFTSLEDGLRRTIQRYQKGVEQ